MKLFVIKIEKRYKTYVVIPRFEEEPNGITAHSMPPVRRRGGINSKQYY